ncbi:type I glutamate--ammonia ligase [Proteinivorax tanatarense]|uniref:Glutamine synthetase n=1 Tax=Proteinivorax tanatarense TaxID=1260629 RepID=A0AAU7VHN9_9FIRM
MDSLSSDDVKQLVREEGVNFIRLQFVDVFGKLKSVSIPAYQLDQALDNKIMFDGSSIKGFVRVEESDMYLAPDPSTYSVLPWTKEGKGKTARLICDVYNTDGTPFEGCPRNVLKNVLKKLKNYGYEYHVGPEVEFFLFETDEDGKPTTDIHDKAGYFDHAPTDLGEDARRDICLALDEMGFEIETSHHEAAPGQHEIDFRYGEALTSADRVSTFKLVVKTIAKQHGLHATFMPKPLKNAHGSCLHLNQSLYKDGKNIFECKDDPMGLSEDAYYFVGGLIKYAREYAAVTNATVNSYKRFVPGYEAPTEVTWATGSRSPLIRIPANRGPATRIELRNPDPTANHYLALAAVLSAGFEGIKNKITPSDCCNENGDNYGDEEVKKFPSSLKEALDEFESSKLMKDSLGKHIFDMYLEAKRKEWRLYSEEIHDWELKHYLKAY